MYNKALQQVAQQIMLEERAQEVRTRVVCEVGQIRYHQDRIVYIVDGAYLRNGRVSNFWNFKPVKPDGTLGKSEGDYDNGNFGALVVGAKIENDIVVLPPTVKDTQ